MKIYCFAPSGYEGTLVEVEVDIRRGIPGLEIVGLPDSAVRESRDRVRVAIRNSGLSFPSDRVLVNLAPADVRKEGSGFDLPIAIALLHASRQFPPCSLQELLVVGELQLSGSIRGVRGILPAVAAGLEQDISRFLVPLDNANEAGALERGEVWSAVSLIEAVNIVWGSRDSSRHETSHAAITAGTSGSELAIPAGGDLSDLQGHKALKRALAIAAAGRHHLLLFGPPGAGKTMAARRLPGILPSLSRENSVAVTRIHSLAGALPQGSGLIKIPPFRMPHHSASAEGLIGGGRSIRPGEVSLAHAGVLLLDEAPEFGKHLLQSLREPVEAGRVDIARAGMSAWYPADFQLIMTANSCPCGNLGRTDGVCICTRLEIQKYWKKLGGPLLDRIDMRVPVKPVDPANLLTNESESSKSIKMLVDTAVANQEKRFARESFSRNARIPAGSVKKYCPLDAETKALFARTVGMLSLSSRACHSVLKISRTVADLSDSVKIGRDHFLEAVYYRRYGDQDLFFDGM
ncbi:MAG: YifB family Mg chelatase-like AAA ATPase [Spirochaetales bacterium]|nr:YifB family Mg chelatase-like AAA ATPase [Spirochaetales bacterium]